MRATTRHTRWILGMAMVLLCMVLGHVDAVSADHTPSATLSCEVSDDACASLIEKEDDMLRAAREMGQWAMPSASVTLQGTAGRVVSLHTAWQRVVRMLGALLTGETSCSNGLTEALHHTLSTKRFHAGYYIYYRCQMRC
ncbi:MAG: hypothetical protein IKY72_02750 [Bacteroidaceae bacterium]|nr:hypothetical protein [Bacteroidaceae bacterium]